jgi:hypothetical protein
MRPNKLECLYLAITFQSSLTFAGNTKSLAKKEHLKGPPIGFTMTLPSNSKTRLDKVSKGKPSSLLGLVVSDEGIKFYNIDTSVASMRNWNLQMSPS